MKKTIFGFTVLWVLVSFPAWAVVFHLDATALGQLRKNNQLQQSIPLNGYFGGTLYGPRDKFSAESNFRLYKDVERDFDDFDLYQTVFHYRPWDKIKIDAGRQFVNEGFSVETLDGIRATLSAAKHLQVSVYSGIPRSVELGDFDTDSYGLQTGLSASLQGVSRTHAVLHAAWRKNDIEGKDWRQNDSLFLSGNLSHQFAVKMTPLIYGLAEVDVSGKILKTGTAGLDFYPLRRLALNLEFDAYDSDRQNSRQTIFGFFSSGRMLKGRFGATWTAIPHWLEVEAGYAYQSFKPAPGNTEAGHLAEIALPVSIEKWNLEITPAYYFSKSFGGRVHGARATVNEQWTKNLWTEVSGDYAIYEKVTNNNDNAISTTGWVGYDFARGFHVAAGGEYNHNTFFNRDVRANLSLGYSWDHGS